LVIVGGVLGLMWLNSKESSSLVSDPNSTKIAPITEVDQVIGDITNPQVTLVEYSDFECPACAYYEPLITEILNDYGDKGLIFTYRHYPLSFHLHALETAKVSEAAGRQNKFWEMKSLLFAGQDKWSKMTPEEAKNTFLTYAESLNLNLDQFKTDLDDPAILAKIQADLKSGNEAGVQGTPTFYLNETEITARTINEFKAQIEAVIPQTKNQASSTINFE